MSDQPMSDDRLVRALELLREVYWRTPETAEWLDLNDAIAALLRDNGGIHTLERAEAEALAADWDQRFPSSAPHVIDGYSAPAGCQWFTAFGLIRCSLPASHRGPHLDPDGGEWLPYPAPSSSEKT